MSWTEPKTEKKRFMRRILDVDDSIKSRLYVLLGGPPALQKILTTKWSLAHTLLSISYFRTVLINFYLHSILNSTHFILTKTGVNDISHFTLRPLSVPGWTSSKRIIYIQSHLGRHSLISCEDHISFIQIRIFKTLIF